MRAHNELSRTVSVAVVLAGLVILAACTPAKTRSYSSDSGSTTSGFNDAGDSWRHTNQDTEKTRNTTGEANRSDSIEKKVFGAAAAAGGEKLGTAMWGPLGGAAGGFVAEIVMGELLNGPPSPTPLDSMPANARCEEVYGLIFNLQFEWDWAWMEDRQQSNEDIQGKRDLTVLIRAYDCFRVIQLTQDKNSVSGWCEIPSFKWPSGKPIEVAIYDRDFLFDDGMVTFKTIDDVYGYWKLVIEDGGKQYVVGKLGFLSQSDVAVLRRDYGSKQVR